MAFTNAQRVEIRQFIWEELGTMRLKDIKQKAQNFQAQTEAMTDCLDNYGQND